MRRALASLGLFVVMAPLVAGQCLAQTAAPAAPPAATPAAMPAATEAAPKTAPKLLDQVVFIGASATAGFGVIVTDPDRKQRSAPLPLAAGFAGAVTSFKDEATPRNFGSSLFFLSPGVTGSAQVDRALELKPTLVVALDFLFWYGYGNDDGGNGTLKNESARLDKLELGFRQLERIDATIPIVIGDLPNMSGAVGKMLSESQMPELKTLEALNAKVREWAAKHANVILFPLSDLVTKLKTGDAITMAGVEFKQESGRLLQSDELHPTARGSIAMSLRIAELLNEKLAKGQTLELVKDETTAQRRAHAAAMRILAKRGGSSSKQAEPMTPPPATTPPSSPSDGEKKTGG